MRDDTIKTHMLANGAPKSLDNYDHMNHNFAKPARSAATADLVEINKSNMVPAKKNRSYDYAASMKTLKRGVIGAVAGMAGGYGEMMRQKGAFSAAYGNKLFGDMIGEEMG